MFLKNQDDLPEEFGGTDEELRLQNDLLKLKMQAELGAHFSSSPDADLPPEIERQFLEQMMAFHAHREDHPPVLLRTHLGNPDFRPASELDEKELDTAWIRLEELYESRQLHVDFLAEYPLMVRYDFLAGELMDEEIEPPFMEGQYLCFIYEEFHPNHDYDQRARTRDFMEGFFQGSFRECYMSSQLITPAGKLLRLEEVNRLLERFHGMFHAIKEWDFQVETTSAQKDEELKEGMPRLGFSEGTISYTAISHDGAEVRIAGPFKLYMECVYDWWSVNHFYMQGFVWGSKETGAP